MDARPCVRVVVRVQCVCMCLKTMFKCACAYTVYKIVIIDQLTRRLSRQFRATFDAVTNIKRHLEANYADFGGGATYQTYQNCCVYESPNATFESCFNTTVGIRCEWMWPVLAGA